MKNELLAKRLLLIDFFSNFGFEQKIVSPVFESGLEIKINCLFNPNYRDYQIIVIDYYQNTTVQKNIINHIKPLIDQEYNKDFQVLNIIIGKNVNEYSSSNLIFIDTDYYEGLDVDNAFPGIKSIIKSNTIKGKALDDVLYKFKKLNKEKMKSLPFFQRYQFLCTYSLIVISIIMFIIQLLLEKSYSLSASVVFLGADYMTFTLGLKQFYRFITSSFLHGGFLHLFLNCYSLYMVGRNIEYHYGHLYFLMTFILSVFFGNITSDIMVGNQLVIGLSGGLYGLLFVYVKRSLDSRLIDMRNIMPLIICNLFINFMPDVAWQVHLGGLVGGFISYWIITSEDKKQPIICCIVVIAVLLIKYYSIKEIYPIYSGTDAEVTQIIYNLGFKDYALELAQKLFAIYEKFGG